MSSVPQMRYEAHMRACKICKKAGGLSCEDQEKYCPEGKIRDELYRVSEEKNGQSTDNQTDHPAS